MTERPESHSPSFDIQKTMRLCGVIIARCLSLLYSAPFNDQALIGHRLVMEHFCLQMPRMVEVQSIASDRHTQIFMHAADEATRSIYLFMGCYQICPVIWTLQFIPLGECIPCLALIFLAMPV